MVVSAEATSHPPARVDFRQLAAARIARRSRNEPTSQVLQLTRIDLTNVMVRSLCPEVGCATNFLKASDAVLHLRRHGIGAVKYRAFGEEDETADVLIAECHALGANLLVMGSYGHSRLAF